MCCIHDLYVLTQVSTKAEALKRLTDTYELNPLQPTVRLNRFIATFARESIINSAVTDGVAKMTAWQRSQFCQLQSQLRVNGAQGARRIFASREPFWRVLPSLVQRK